MRISLRNAAARVARWGVCVLVLVSLAVGFVPAAAVAEALGEIQTEEGAAARLGDAVEAAAREAEAQSEPLAALWDRIAAVEVAPGSEDVDAEALEALCGRTSTSAGVTRAFVLVAQELGYGARESAGAGDLPLAVLETSGGEVELDVAAGLPGERPWEQSGADTPEGDVDAADLPEEDSDDAGAGDTSDAEAQAADAASEDAEDVDADEAAELEAQAAAEEEAAELEAQAAAEAEAKEVAAGDDGATSGVSSKLGTGAPKSAETSPETGLEAQSTKVPHVYYRVHRQTYSWEKGWKSDGVVSGTTGQSKRLEGIYVKLGNLPVSGSVKYRTHVQRDGWQDWRSANKLSGTTGRSLRLEAIQIKLTGELAKRYDVYYRVHAQSFGWMGWAKNGARAGTAGYSKRLEAIQIVLMKKGKSPGATFKGVRRNTSAAFKEYKPLTISGTCWKIELPEYWRGKIDIQNYGGGSESYHIGSNRLTRNLPVLMVSTIDQNTYNHYNRMTPIGAYVRLKDGKSATVRLGDNGYIFFLVRLSSGDYLMVSTVNYKLAGSFIPPAYSYSSYELGVTADLQSCGMLRYTTKDNHEVPAACLHIIAGGTTTS